MEWAAPATIYLFSAYPKMKMKRASQPLQNIMEEKLRIVCDDSAAATGGSRAGNAGRLRRLSVRGRRDSTLLFLCDGESAGLATKVASSRTISRSSSAYCSLVRLLSPCDKLPRLSERCSLPDGQSRWLSVVCSRRRRTN